MNFDQLKKLLQAGESSALQFKEKMPHRDSMAQELVAMSNSYGGQIILGIQDVTSQITGLSLGEVEAYDKVIAEIADYLKPPIYVATDIVLCDDEAGGEPKRVLVVSLREGVNKPYKTSKGEIYLKQGSNKRLLTDNAEILRLFQQGANLSADEMIVEETSLADIDAGWLEEYVIKEFERPIKELGISQEQLLKAKKLYKAGCLTLGGLLFFGKNPQAIKPAFCIKVVSLAGNELSDDQYLNKPRDLTGSLPKLFEKSLDFLKSNLTYRQENLGFNSQGRLEISCVALEELIQNALIHRDYFKNSPIRILVFKNRIEIISPGKLPNSLTTEDIKYGNPVIRNPHLAALASHALPYSGLGSGIKRALREEPAIQFENDQEGEQFKVTIPRLKAVTPNNTN